ncbi:MAG: hypothetical protein JO006_12855 [Paucibacter sp.]|nr:hypothetical protein [Roseateles sp.]
MWLHIACESMLAACGALAALNAWRARSVLASLGFGLISSSALLGAIVYAGVEDAVAAHDELSLLAARIALLLIAAQGLRNRRWTVGVAVACALSLVVPPPADLAISMLALVAIAWKGRSRDWPSAIAGAALFVLAGLVIGTRGEWLGVPRVDLFHLSIAAAVLAWLRAGLR